MSTIHAAKGAEWYIVHVIHLTDGALPSDLASGHPEEVEEVEEERRLLHVAMTRARRELWLHVPLRYDHHRQNSQGRDAHGYPQRSRFLSAAVAGNVDELTAAAATPTEPIVVGAEPRSPEVDAFLSSLLG